MMTDMERRHWGPGGYEQTPPKRSKQHRATVSAARAKLAAAIRSLGDDDLLKGVTGLADDDDADCVVVRVAMLNEYEKRYGGEAVDALMDSLGL